LFHTIFRAVFTSLPFIVVVAMFGKAFNEGGVDGLFMVAKATIGMAVGVGFLFLIARLYYQKDKIESGDSLP